MLRGGWTQPIAQLATGLPLVMLLILATVACSRMTSGEPLIGSSGREPHVEWVTDPESSDSSRFVSVTLHGDGTFQIGKDFPPGLYESAGSFSSSPCSWQVLTIASQGAEVAVRAGGGRDHQRVAIGPTDARFATRSCQDWRMVG